VIARAFRFVPGALVLMSIGFSPTVARAQSGVRPATPAPQQEVEVKTQSSADLDAFKAEQSCEEARAHVARGGASEARATFAGARRPLRGECAHRIQRNGTDPLPTRPGSLPTRFSVTGAACAPRAGG
jgi:hypothetical protein